MAGLITRIFSAFGGRKANDHRIREYTFGEGIEPLLEEAVLGDMRLNQSTAIRLYSQSAIVATAVDAIVKKIEGIPLVIADNEGNLNSDDEIIRFLKRPNDHEVYRQLIGSVARDWLLCGNAYLHLIGRESSKPSEIYRSHPTYNTPISDQGESYPTSYDVTSRVGMGHYPIVEPGPGERGARFIREDGLFELLHLRGYATRTNALIGDSPLEAVIKEIRQHLLGLEHNTNTLSKGARLSMLVAIKAAMDEGTFKRTEKALIDRFGGSGKAGSVGVIAGGDMDIQEMGVNNKDMDYVELMEMVRSSVISRFGVPLPIVVASRQTHSNYEEAVEALYDDAVLPNLEAILEPVSNCLLSRFGRDPERERLAYDPLGIPSIRKRRISEVKEMASLNAVTVNEIRGMLPGCDPWPSGDVVLAPGTLSPAIGPNVDPVEMMEEDREAAAEAAQMALTQAENEGRENNSARDT